MRFESAKGASVRRLRSVWHCAGFPVLALTLAAWALLPSLKLRAVDLLVYADPGSTLRGRDDAVIDNPRFSHHDILRFARSLKGNEKFLVYRQAEFAYYAPETRWIYDFDPQIMPLYDIKSVEEAHRYLIGQGIRYVYLPNYMPSTLYNSAVLNLIGDPSLSREIITRKSHRLIQLHDSPVAARCVGRPESPRFPSRESVKNPFDARSTILDEESPSLFWDVANDIARRWPDITSVAGSMSGTAALTMRESARAGFPAGAVRSSWLSGPAFPVLLSSHPGAPDFAPAWPRPPEASHVRFRLKLKGEGLIEAFLIEYNAREESARRLAFDAVLKDPGEPRAFDLNLKLSSGTKSARLVLRNAGLAQGKMTAALTDACYIVYPSTTPEENQAASLSDDAEDEMSAAPETASSIPLARLEPASLETLGGRVLPGGLCHIRLWPLFRCMRYNPDTEIWRLFVQRGDREKQDGLYLRPYGLGRIEIATDLIRGSWRTYWQSRLSTTLWQWSRSESRRDPLLRLLSRAVASVLPDAQGPRGDPYRIEADLSGPENGNIGVTLFWDDPQGFTQASFAGWQLLRHERTLGWTGRAPKEARNLRAVLTFPDAKDPNAIYHLSRIGIDRQADR